MIVAALSDIHSNASALAACLDEARSLGAQAFLFLGDLVSDCARPRESIALVRETLSRFPGAAIRGNREETLLAARRGEIAPLEGSMGFTQDRLGEEDWRFLESLSGPLFWEAGEGLTALRLCHGSPARTREKLLAGSDEARFWSVHAGADALLCGHTHIPFIARPGSAWVVNCGSVGVPCTGDPRASFVLLTAVEGAWRAEIVRVAYDPEDEIAAMRANGMSERDPVWAAGIVAHLRDGREWCGVMLDRAAELAREEGLPVGDSHRFRAARELGLLPRRGLGT